MANTDLPVNLIMGRLTDVSKSDVENYCRGLINKYITEKDNSFFFVKKYGNITFYEIQEGGNRKAFTPHLIKLLEEGDLDEIIIPSGDRPISVKVRDDDINFQVLPNNKDVVVTDVKRSGSMTPYTGDSRHILAIGITSLLAGIVVMGASYLTYIYGNQLTNFSNYNFNLNSLYNEITNIEERALNDKESYVKKLTFNGSSWMTEFGYKETELIEEKKIRNSFPFPDMGNGSESFFYEFTENETNIENNENIGVFDE